MKEKDKARKSEENVISSRSYLLHFSFTLVLSLPALCEGGIRRDQTRELSTFVLEETDGFLRFTCSLRASNFLLVHVGACRHFFCSFLRFFLDARDKGSLFLSSPSLLPLSLSLSLVVLRLFFSSREVRDILRDVGDNVRGGAVGPSPVVLLKEERRIRGVGLGGAAKVSVPSHQPELREGCGLDDMEIDVDDFGLPGVASGRNGPLDDEGDFGVEEGAEAAARAPARARGVPLQAH